MGCEVAAELPSRESDPGDGHRWRQWLKIRGELEGRGCLRTKPGIPREARLLPPPLLPSCLIQAWKPFPAAKGSRKCTSRMQSIAPTLAVRPDWVRALMPGSRMEELSKHHGETFVSALPSRPLMMCSLVSLHMTHTALRQYLSQGCYKSPPCRRWPILARHLREPMEDLFVDKFPPGVTATQTKQGIYLSGCTHN